MEIALYIALDNPTRVLSFIDEREDRCAALGNAPGIGTARPERGEGVRMLPHGRHLIFYRQARLQTRRDDDDLAEGVSRRERCAKEE